MDINKDEISKSIETFVAFFTVAGLLWKPFKYVFTKIKNKIKRREEIDCMVERMYREFTPNDGKSLTNRVDDIYKNLGDIRTNLEENTRLTETIVTKQRWLMNTRSEPIFEADCDGNLFWFNRTYIDLVKRPPEDLIDNGWKMVIHEEDRERVEHEWKSCIQDKRTFESEFRIVDVYGNFYSVKCIAQKVNDGEDCCFVGYFQNVKKL